MNKNIIRRYAMKTCVTCRKPLTGHQTKYCCRVCHNKSGNARLQNYELQQKRGRNRRNKLIAMHDGKCDICGYDKNSAGLTFHHNNPKEKSFPLDLRLCSNRTWEKLVKEANKCRLLCQNCHVELHNPDFIMDPVGFEPTTNEL